MKTALLLLIGAIVGAIAHESDMARACAKFGHTNHSGWFVDLECKPATQTGGGHV